MFKNLTRRVLLFCILVSLSAVSAYGCGSNTASDTTPPVIEGISAQGIGTTGGTIVWTTDEEASSQVEYGVSDTYGSQTQADSDLVKSHSVALSNLNPGTTYYYRVISIDSAGNRSQSSGWTFKTLGEFTITGVTTSFVPWNYAGNYLLQSLSIKVTNTKDVTVNVAGGQFSLDGGNTFTLTTSQAILPGETRTFSVSTSVSGVTKGPKQLSLTLKDSQSSVLATYTASVSP